MCLFCYLTKRISDQALVGSLNPLRDNIQEGGALKEKPHINIVWGHSARIRYRGTVFSLLKDTTKGNVSHLGYPRDIGP